MGIAYGLFGIIVLCEFVIRSDKLKSFMVRWIAGLLLWAHSVVPIGAFIGACIGHELPSAGFTGIFFVSFFVYSIWILVAVDAAVFSPKIKRFQSLDFRHQVFGLILVITGVILQLVAAIKDFNN